MGKWNKVEISLRPKKFKYDIVYRLYSITDMDIHYIQRKRWIFWWKCSPIYNSFQKAQQELNKLVYHH